MLGKSDDARRLTCDFLCGEADLLPDPDTQCLHIILHGLSNPQANAAVRVLLKTHNDTDTLNPGTRWKLRYRLVVDPAS